MSNTKIHFSAFLFLLIFLAAACGLMNRLKKTPEPAIDYRPVPENLQPDIYAHRISEKESKVHLRIPKYYLIAGKKEEDSNAKIALRVNISAVTDPESEKVAENVSFLIEPTVQDISKPFIYKTFNFPAIENLHWLRVSLTDEVKGISQLYFLKIPHQNNCPNCVVMNAESHQPIYRQSLKLDESFALSCNGVYPDSILVHFHPFDLKISPKEQSDSSWYQKPINGNYEGWDKEGVYTISGQDVNPKINVKVFSANFPVLTTPNQLVEPLIYIAKRDEIAALDTVSKRKIAIDNFWLSRAETPKQARKLIENYYGRVFWANQIFIELVPGWQTDRGKTLILLGIPEEAISNGKTEKWLFKNENDKKFWVEFTDSDTTSILSNFKMTKKIPPEVEKFAIEAWNRGEPITFGKINQEE